VASPSPTWSDLDRLVPHSWERVLDRRTVDVIHQIGKELQHRSATDTIVPSPENVLRALEVDPSDVRVLIVGQDPYPTPGHAMGLSFSLPRGTSPLPPSAKNILAELHSDIGLTSGNDFDLTPWAKQGVLLLNRHLTTSAHVPGAHASLGWEEISDSLVRGLVSINSNFVAILWGRHAQKLSPMLSDVPVIESAHPSPLSARRGFFGSRPFSRANNELVQMGMAPIDWSLG